MIYSVSEIQSINSIATNSLMRVATVVRLPNDRLPVLHLCFQMFELTLELDHLKIVRADRARRKGGTVLCAVVSGGHGYGRGGGVPLVQGAHFLLKQSISMF